MTDALAIKSMPDPDLVARIQQTASAEEQSALFDVICQRHGKQVLSLCAGLLWDDLGTAEAAAQEALQDAYRALIQGRPPEDPRKLRAWLYGIARRRCQQEIRRRGPRASLPDALPDDTYEADSRQRQAEVDRMLAVVAASFTEKQRLVYELSTVRGMRGLMLATALDVSEKEAYDDAYENKARLLDGFGTLVLALEGRPYCPGLAAILDQAAWNGETLTKVLRLRILRHLGTCPTCSNCSTCQEKKKELIRPFAPALLPILAWGALHERVMNSIRLSYTQPSARPGDNRRPPPAGTTRPGPGGQQRRPRPAGALRRVPLPALAGTTAVVVFVLALLITHVGFAQAGGQQAGGLPAAARMPTIAYASRTSLVTRKGAGRPQVLAAVPAGSEVHEMAWSADGRWLSWLTGPVGRNINQVHITDVRARSTHSWTCGAGCAQGTFQGSNFLMVSRRGNDAFTAYPAAGGAPADVPVLPAGTKTVLPPLASTPPGTAVVFLAYNLETLGNDLQLYRSAGAGTATSLFSLPANAVPGGDRDPGGEGLTGVSPDRTTVAFAGNYVGSDAGIGSDTVTVINLITGAHRTVQLPLDRTHPLRAAAVWLDSSDRAYASAWHQPGNAAKSSIPASFSVTPAVYRLDGGRWVPTGGTGITVGGGPGGWTGLTSGRVHFGPGGYTADENLVAVSGGTRVPLASGVTAFAWAPAAYLKPRQSF